MQNWMDYLRKTDPAAPQPVPGTAEYRKVVLDEMIGPPRVLTVHGKDVDFFLTGQLAKALNRSPVTIRSWEQKGIIPVTPYCLYGKDARGNRRLYSRAQVEGMVQIAQEEGILTDTYKAIKKTHFSKRVSELFVRLILEDQ